MFTPVRSGLDEEPAKRWLNHFTSQSRLYVVISLTFPGCFFILSPPFSPFLLFVFPSESCLGFSFSLYIAPLHLFFVFKHFLILCLCPLRVQMHRKYVLWDVFLQFIPYGTEKVQFYYWPHVCHFHVSINFFLYSTPSVISLLLIFSLLHLLCLLGKIDLIKNEKDYLREIAGQ